jgi:hypothetical protein
LRLFNLADLAFQFAAHKIFIVQPVLASPVRISCI